MAADRGPREQADAAQRTAILHQFYCGDAYYARAADRLRENCAALDIPLSIEAIPDHGCYWRNTLVKPRFIRENWPR